MAENERANRRTALIPGTTANRERGLSGPPTVRQRVNTAKAAVTGRMSPGDALKALRG